MRYREEVIITINGPAPRQVRDIPTYRGACRHCGAFGEIVTIDLAERTEKKAVTWRCLACYEQDNAAQPDGDTRHRIGF